MWFEQIRKSHTHGPQYHILILLRCFLLHLRDILGDIMFRSILFTLFILGLASLALAGVAVDGKVAYLASQAADKADGAANKASVIAARATIY